MTATSLTSRHDAKLAALEQRVYGLERGVHDLNQLFTGRIGEVSAQLSSLAAKLDERSRTPWATLVSAMGVVLAIVIAGGELARTPLVDGIVRLEREQAALERRAAPVAAFAERARADDLWRAAIERRLDLIDGALRDAPSRERQ